MNNTITFNDMRRNGWTRKLISKYGLEPTIVYIPRGNKKQTFKRSRKVEMYNRDEVERIENTKEFLDIRNQQKFFQEKNIKKQQIFNEIEEAAFYAQKLICHGENEEEVINNFSNFKKEMLLKLKSC